MKSQKGSAHIFIVAALVVLLTAALGFIFWQNFAQKSDSKDNSVDTSATDTAKEEKESLTSDKEEVKENGTIAGSLTYPAESIPSALEVHATNIATNEEFVTKEHLTGSTYAYGVGYKLSVPVGDYYVYGLENPTADTRAYYNNFVECGFIDQDNCQDYSKKIVVSVVPNKETKDITVGDWYNPCLISGRKQPTTKFDMPSC